MKQWLILLILLTGCTMRDIDGNHIGGQEVGAVNIETVGDEEAATRYIGYARAVLGGLKQYMQLSEIRAHYASTTLDDGTEIRAHSILGQDGFADVDKIWINVPQFSGGGTLICVGFVANVTEPNQNGTLFVKHKSDADNEYMSIFWGEYDTPIARDLLAAEPGVIDGTYEGTNVSEEPGKQVIFYYWDVDFSSTAVTLSSTPTFGSVEPPTIDYGDPVYVPFFKLGSTVGNGSNIAYTSEASYSAEQAFRNYNNNIAMYAKPYVSGLGKVTLRDDPDDAFVAVIPGNVKYDFSHETWDEKKNRYTEEFDVTVTYDVFRGDVTDGQPIYGIISELGITDFDLQGHTTAWVYGTHHISQQLYPKNFTADSTVKNGDYIVQAFGDVEITLICLNEKNVPVIFKVNHDFDNSYSEAYVITIGRQFIDVPEIVKVKDATRVFETRDGEIVWIPTIL